MFDDDSHELAECWKEKIDQLKGMIYEDLLEKTPTGFRPRPGVSKEQLLQALKIVEKVSTIQSESIQEWNDFNNEVEEFEKEVEETRGSMRNIERITGTPLPPLLRQMYRL